MNSSGFDGSSLVIDGRSFQCAWPIVSVVDLVTVVVVMFDPDAQEGKWGQFANVVAFGRDGSECWVGELPTTETGDRYYGVLVESDGVVRARSVKSFSVELDALTGRIVNREFTK